MTELDMANTTNRRLSELEVSAKNHSESISKLVELMGGITANIKQLENWQIKEMMEEVRREERDKSLQDRLDRMEGNFERGLKEVRSDISSMRSVWTRILWLVAGVVIPAIVVGTAVVMVIGADGILKLT